jgi:membrane glycosyltransferase
MSFSDTSDRRISGPDDRSVRAQLFRAPAVGLRRLVFFGLVAVTFVWGVRTMFGILSANGTTAIEAVILVLFGLTFGWISVSFWTGVAGFLVKLLGLDATTLRPTARFSAEDLDEEIISRTAVVMPICNEDTARVFAGLEAVYRSIKKTGEIEKFDFYVLSDTRDARIAAAEESGWAGLCRRLDAHCRLFYRRRRDNVGRKAGNIADFCRRWGRRYEGMTVLDADSVMSGSTMVTLARALQAAPEAGIIQTVPVPARQVTLFGRIVQFASRLYSPMLANGLAFWQLGEANFWGHNAIIRLTAFTRHCGLPALPGAPPLGGEILSHDFVEAAYLRRGGWKVYLLPDLEGSYEEVPGNILDFAKRDRRWAQGNIQHLKLLTVRGLHPLSRLHFALGALAYGSSLIWFVLLMLSTIDALNRALNPAGFFGIGYQLFPDWTIVDETKIRSLIAVTAALLILPKILGVLLACFEPAKWRAFGGVRLIVSAVLEIAFSVVLAPVMMTLHSYFVASILAGRKVSWDPQNRDATGISMASSAKALFIPSLIGVAWGSVTYAVSPIFFWWLSPVIFGLVVAIPLCAWTSRAGAGRMFRRMGVFLTPEEIAPNAELKTLEMGLARSRAPGGRLTPWLRSATTWPPEARLDMKPQPLNRWSPFTLGRRSGVDRPA